MATEDDNGRPQDQYCGRGTPTRRTAHEDRCISSSMPENALRSLSPAGERYYVRTTPNPELAGPGRGRTSPDALLRDYDVSVSPGTSEIVSNCSPPSFRQSCRSAPKLG